MFSFLRVFCYEGLCNNKIVALNYHLFLLEYFDTMLFERFVFLPYTLLTFLISFISVLVNVFVLSVTIAYSLYYTKFKIKAFTETLLGLSSQYLGFVLTQCRNRRFQLLCGKGNNWVKSHISEQNYCNRCGINFS